jgi:hypothetical protein
MPASYEFLARGMLWAIADMNLMFDWFAAEGYKADIEECRGIYKGLLDWEEWLANESAWCPHD